jgi:uncharacterized membrane protein
MGWLPGWYRSQASGASYDGNVLAGTNYDEFGSVAQAFRWTLGAGMQGLGWATPGSFYSEGLAISRDGSTIVGQDAGHRHTDAFVWTEETGMHLLPGLPGATSSLALGVNFNGSLVVGYSGGQPMLWRDGTLTNLGIIDAFITRAVATSDDGAVIVGNADFARAMIWLNGGNAQYLSDYLGLAGIAVPEGWVLRQATAVSADGRTIAGYAQRGNENAFQGFVVTIPTPATFVALGIVGIHRALRRRR